MKRRRVILILLILGVINLDAFTLGAGIFYPKLFFSFHNVNKNFDWGPANISVDKANENTPEINVLFRQAGNSFKCTFFPVFLTKKNYSSLHIYEIVYIYEGKEYLVLENAKFLLESQTREIGSPENGWITNGTYYWMNGWEARPENPKDKSKRWPETNFEKIFKKKNPEDKFPFSIRITYQFDDAEKKTIDIPFEVVTTKGSYTSIFAGM